MLYLYLGYLLVKFYPFMDKLSQSHLPVSAVYFSISVFAIWTFIPIIGYLVGKLFYPYGTLNKYMLSIFGLSIGLIEDGFFYFNILTYQQTNIATLITFFLFFTVAYISINTTTKTSSDTNQN